MRQWRDAIATLSRTATSTAGLRRRSDDAGFARGAGGARNAPIWWAE